MITSHLVDFYEDWWNGRNQQPLLAIYVGDPRFDVRVHMPSWMDPSAGSILVPYSLPFCAKEHSLRPLQDVLRVLDARHIYSGLEYCGAAFPSEGCDFGAVSTAGAISDYAKADPSTRSVWFELDEGWSLERIAALPEDASSPLGDLYRNASKEIVRHFGERFLIKDEPIFGILDTLAALRTSKQLIMDCLDSPELVLAAIQALDRISWRRWTEMRALLDPPNQGISSSWGLLSRKPFAPSQSDFSVLLSPALFEEFALPSIRQEAQRIGRAIYHLDGPEQIKYLDLLLAIPEIRAIQWPPYPGTSVFNGDWDDLIRKVLDSGRRFMSQGRPPDFEALPALFSRFPREAFHWTFWVPDVKTGEKFLQAGLLQNPSKRTAATACRPPVLGRTNVGALEGGAPSPPQGGLQAPLDTIGTANDHI